MSIVDLHAERLPDWEAAGVRRVRTEGVRRLTRALRHVRRRER